MPLHIRKYATDRNRYPAYRMSVAIERLVNTCTPEGKTKATKWAMAWAKVEVSPRAWRMSYAYCQMCQVIEKAAMPHTGLEGSDP